ncbi:hypothetical protein GOV12_00795, partial [Candidatus Pacearchaeota archaeon]|nr:hypothetical protein [Candidatus Pacearchaeota archaeon]
MENYSNVNEIIKGFENKKILIIGDSILDVMVHSKVIGHAHETPTLKAEEIKTDYSFGGASNIVNNILGLDANCYFITILGNDQDGDYFKNYNHNKFNLLGITEDNRKTIAKKRFWIEKSG